MVKHGIKLEQLCFPSKHKQIVHICTMLDQRLADVVQMLYKCFVFAG